MRARVGGWAKKIREKENLRVERSCRLSAKECTATEGIRRRRLETENQLKEKSNLEEFFPKSEPFSREHLHGASDLD